MKLFLVVDDMIVYIVNTKETNKNIELIVESARLQGAKLTCKKSVTFLYTKNTHVKIEIKAQCHCTSCQDGRVGKPCNCILS